MPVPAQSFWTHLEIVFSKYRYAEAFLTSERAEQYPSWEMSIKTKKSSNVWEKKCYKAKFGARKDPTIIKEGMLMKQTSSFQRWKRRYFKLRGRTLYYAKTAKSIIFDEVDLTDASVAESSTKNVNNSFTDCLGEHLKTIVIKDDSWIDEEKHVKVVVLIASQCAQYFKPTQHP
ncbi:Diacylglycerol kinase delta [Varanus komodoensis]|nr:Diacylglycerol kinase delta [Varanus komodoensis]